MVDGAPPRSLSAVRFRWQGRFGFFLRAEAPVVGLGYPLPPRTAVLGLIANVLGFPKDVLATELAEAHIAVSGSLPRTHWHGCNLRKIKSARHLPPSFPQGRSTELFASKEQNTQTHQEWLLNPCFEVVASLPARWHDDFAARIREGRWHFSPCMGLSEMLATLEALGEESLTLLPEGPHRVHSVARVHDGTRLDTHTVLQETLRVLSISLPRTVTPDRSFTHALYYTAPHGDALPVHSREAWQSTRGPLVFL